MIGHRPSPDILLKESNAALRAALYMRVSNGRQAEHDLSIPDQRGQLKSWCSANGYSVVAEYVEATECERTADAAAAAYDNGACARPQGHSRMMELLWAWCSPFLP